MRNVLFGVMVLLSGLCSSAQAQRQAEWFPTPSAAAPPYWFQHNGSPVRFVMGGDRIEAVYNYNDDKASVLLDQGTILLQLFVPLIDSVARYDKVYGTASVFTPCFRDHELTYRVTGKFNKFLTRLELKGDAPVVNPKTCEITHTRKGSNAANLLFEADNRAGTE